MTHAITLIFPDQCVAVIEEQGGRPRGALVDLEQPAERIVDEIGLERAGVAGAAIGTNGRGLRPFLNQPVLDVVEIDAGPVGGDVAVRIVTQARSGGARILVEAADAPLLSFLSLK